MNTKKKLSQALCILSAAVMMLSATGCGNKNSGGTADNGGSGAGSSSDPGSGGNAELADVKKVRVEYKTEKIPAPEGVNYINDFIVTDDERILFTNTEYNYNEKTMESTSKTTISQIGIDGKIISTEELTAEKLPGDTSAEISNIKLMKDGSIWYFENHTGGGSTEAGADPAEDGAAETEAPADAENTEETSAEEAPAEEAPAEDAAAEDAADTGAGADAETPEMPEPVMEDYDMGAYSTTIILKHRSASGEELDSINISDIPELKDESLDYVSNFMADDNGHIVIASDSKILVLDNTGKFLFKIDSVGEGENVWVNGMAMSGMGDVCVSVYQMSMSEDGYSATNIVKKVNFETKQLEEYIKVTNLNGSILPGNSSYPFLFVDGTSLCGLKEDGSYDEIINMINVGVDSSYVSSVAIIGDDYLIPPSPSYDSSEEEPGYFQRITKLDPSEVKEKTLVTLGAYYLSETVRSAIIYFNENSDEYSIQVNDYSKYNDYSGGEDGYNAGMTKLNAEITAGNIPDILCIGDISNLENYARKGILADINTFIENDPDYNRDDYCDSILRAMEDGGKLYSYPINYYLIGFTAKQKFFPNDGAVSMDDLMKFKGQGMNLYSNDADRKSFMQIALIFGVNSFIDKNTGECHFNSDEFKKILELSKEFPEEINYDMIQNDPDYWDNYSMQFRNEKTLTNIFYFYNYNEFNNTEQGQFGDKISLLGMPGTNSGPAIMPSATISISATSPNAQAGWELIKASVSAERQSKNDWAGFPMNKEARKKLAEKNMEVKTYTDENGNEVEEKNTYWVGDTEIEISRTDQAVVDRLNNLIDTSDNVIIGAYEDVTNIIYEEAASYYSGQNSVDQCADMIQSRVQIYLSEQS